MYRCLELQERYDDEGIVELPEGTEDANEGAEGSTGPDTHGHLDKSEAKCEIAAMKYEIQRLDHAVSSMEPNMSTLRQKLGHIESSLPKMKEDIVKDIVAEVLKALTSKGSDNLALIKEKMPNPSDEVKWKTGICNAAIKGNNFSSLAAKLPHARLAGSINTKAGSASAMEVMNAGKLLCFHSHVSKKVKADNLKFEAYPNLVF